MSDEEFTVVVAMPLHTADRQFIRQLLDHPLPSIYPNSTAMPCSECGITLAVGPRSTAVIEKGAKLYCPICLAKLSSAAGVDISDKFQSLGNPESGWEKD